MDRHWLRAGALLLVVPLAAGAADSGEAVHPEEVTPLVRATIRTDRPIIQSGRPVWVEFTLSNLTNDPLTLRVPNAPVDETAPAEMGLPLAHVFSGPGYSGVTVRDARGETFDASVALRPKGPTPAVRLAPHGTVGIRLDLTKYYESLLQRPGDYTLVWRPYDATVESVPLTLTLMAERQAVILTRQGKLTMRFYYDEAPVHVQNFIELVEQRFYDNLTFHRVVPGFLIQGGDPLGDGRGVRPDGKRLHAEFSRIPFDIGTVGMARSPRDPNSASCQFFICLSRQPSFDGQQTAFGYLVGDESFETLRQIAAVPIGPKEKPLKPVYIQTISLENVPPREREIAISSRPAASTVDRATGQGSSTRRPPPMGYAVTRRPTASQAAP